MTTLFTQGERTRKTSRRYNESHYSFLESSGWKSVSLVRDFWESWFALYNEDKKYAMARRFQSADNHTHLSAFVELLTFAVLKHGNYQISFEPPIGELALDFHASGKDLPSLYAECTATGRPLAQVSTDAREAEIVEAIDKVPTGQFLLLVQFEERGAENLPLRPLRNRLTAWLESLAGQDSPSEAQQFDWKDRGWTIRIKALPTEIEVEDDGGALGILGPHAFDNDQPLRLRSALDGKATKYGDLGQPLIVVLNSTEMQSERDLMTALLGDVLWHVNHATHEVTTGRKSNGVFYDSKSPRNVALSAVMHGHFNALSFADRDFRLVHHPLATYPLPKRLFPFCKEIYFDPESGDAIEVEATMNLGQFFGLEDDWPFFSSDDQK
jgi:hypothetical protein